MQARIAPALLISLLTTAAGCTCGGDKNEPAADPAPSVVETEGSAEAEPAAEAGPCGGEHPDAVAFVACEPVMTAAELQADVARQVERFEALPGREPTDAAWRNDRRRRTVRRAVQTAVLDQHLRDAGVQATDEEVADRIRAEIAHVYDNELLYERFLASRGVTREQHDADVRREIALDTVLAERARETCTGDPDTDPRCRLEPTDEDVQTFYQENRERWREGERVKARVITVRLRPNPSDEAVAEAEARIAALRARVEGGEPFADVAREGSETSEAARGGDRGWIVRGRRRTLVENGVEAELFDTTPGSLTPTLRTELGFQFFLVEDHRPEGFRELDEIREVLHGPLLRRNRDRLARDLENELVQSLDIVYVEENWGFEDEAAGSSDTGQAAE